MTTGDDSLHQPPPPGHTAKIDEGNQMDLESRLSQHLKETGDGIDAPPTDVAQPKAIVGRRRRRRWMAGAALSALAIVAGTGIASVIAEDSGDEFVAATEEDAPAEGSDSTDDIGGENDEARPEGESQLDGTGATIGGDELPVSTGPTLQWTAVDGGPDLASFSIGWSGRSFVAVAADRGEVLRSSDGETWTPTAPLPGVNPLGLTAANGSIVVWGSDEGNGPTDELGRLTGPVSVLVSSDDGDSWTDLGPLTTDPIDEPSSYLTPASPILSAATMGDTVVVAAIDEPLLDLDRLLADQGLEAPAGDLGYHLEFADDSENFSVVVCIDLACEEEQVFELSDLDLSETDLAALTGRGGTSVHRSVNGGSFEVVDLGVDDTFIDTITVADGNFVAVVNEAERTGLYVSSDGASWAPRETDIELFGPLTATDRGLLYATSWGPDGAALVRSDDGGRTWTTTSPTGAPPSNGLAVGPAGVAVIGQLGELGQPVAMDPIVIEKDGYTVYWAEDALTLTDPDGDVVIDLSPEELAADEPPETIIVGDDSDSNVFTFLDPITFEPLLSLTEADLGESFPGATAGDGSEVEPPEMLVGWSADGETWGWQTSADAFGFNGWPQLIVGDDVVLAVVDPVVSNALDDAESVQSLFVASVG